MSTTHLLCLIPAIFSALVSSQPIAHSSDVLTPTSLSLQQHSILPETISPIADTPFFAEIAELVNLSGNDLAVAETHIFRPLFRYRAVTVEHQRRQELNINE